ncbi:MAG: hypothetical protein JJ939_03725 [Alphaproteobacteria bacterium]|nr:hypothetical protein [Alphaproteobacteria bacterium]MBO6627512.1 hypothetical protein [Alphaproteobacteria bacterium]MDF1627155.1 hypothetical protein [Parvibaculaceae bacterium]
MKSTSSYVPQVRLLPSVIVCATVLLGLKLVGLSVDMEALLDPVPSAYAEAAEDMENGEAGAESATMSDPAAGDPSEVAAKPDGQTAEGQAAPVVDPALSLADFDTPSAAEQNLLRSLGERRKELDAREREIQLQGRLLEASERRIQSRIEELKEIEARVEQLFGVQEEEQEQQLTSLVTMYESMKPKDAARILGQLDMDVLLQVVRRMSERKMAPILAAMDPIAAQDLTVQLVTGSALPEDDMLSTAMGGVRVAR